MIELSEETALVMLRNWYTQRERVLKRVGTEQEYIDLNRIESEIIALMVLGAKND